MAVYKQAKLLRTLYFNQINETFDVGSVAKSDPSLRYLFSIRYRHIRQALDNFHVQHHAILAALSKQENSDPDAEDEIRKLAEEKYFAIEDLYNSWFPNNHSSNNQSCLNSSTIGNNSVKVSHIRLPKIPLRTFDGSFKQWLPFKQSYDSTIHNSMGVATSDKFQYLLNSLTNEPYDLIKSLDATDANYQIAYDMLVTRYDDKRKLSTAYWHDIQSIDKLNNDSAESLRELFDRFRQDRLALQGLKIAENLEDFLFFNLLFDKLDLNTRKSFEVHCRTLPSQEIIPKLTVLENFLESHCKILDSVQESIVMCNQFESKSGTIPKSTKIRTMVAKSPPQTNSDIKCSVC